MTRLGPFVLLLAAVWSSRAAAQDRTVDGDTPTIRTIARVIATGDVDGRFAHPVCDESRDLVPSEHARFTYALSRNARDPDRPLVIDTGGLLAPNGVVRFASQRDAAGVARLVRDLGYRALAFGLNDLAAPRGQTIRIMRELRAMGIPMIASNLRCAPSASALCDELVDASDGVSTHLVNGRLAAVISVVRPDARRHVDPERAEGIEITDPSEAIARYTRMAEEAGAEIVIAVVDNRIEGGALRLAAELPEDARPDLLLVSEQDELLFARPQTVRPVLVGPSEQDAVEVRIRDSLEIHDGYEFLAQPLSGRGISVAEPVRDWIDDIGATYCEAWGRPLAGAPLEASIDAEAMLAMVAEIIRERTGADLAIINRQAIDRRWQQAQEGALTASDIYIAIQYDEQLVTADVDERWLKRVTNVVEDRPDELAIPGMSFSGSRLRRFVRVGGHYTDARARYRVVTIQFLAQGGRELLPELGALGEWEHVEDTSLRQMVLDYLETPRTEDPREALPEAEGTLEWTFRADADLSFSGSGIDNPRQRCTEEMLAAMPDLCDAEGFVIDDSGARSPAYASSQLTTSDVITFGLNLNLAANAAAPDWTWSNTGSFLYQTAWTEPTGPTGNAFVEAADQIRGRSTLSWRGARYGNSDLWFVPDPTADVFIESEFTEPDERGYHWFLLRPTLGVRFQFTTKFQLQLMGGMQTQVFDPQAQVEGGFGATLTLSPWVMFRYDLRTANLEFTFDYFVTVGDTTQGTLRGTLGTSYDLAGPLAFTLNANLFVQHQSEQDVGAAISVIAGIRLGYLGRVIAAP